MIRSLFILLLIALFCSSSFSQDADFFWSLQDLNSGAVNAPLNVVAETGDTLSLYLYYTTNGPSNSDLRIGALLDLAPSKENVIRFTDAETFDFPITIQDIKIGDRWGSEFNCSDTFGRLGTVTDSFINEWGAFTLFEQGLDHRSTDNPFLDAGYDEAADAFLFGRVDIEVVGKFDTSVQILMGRGNGGIVSLSESIFDQEFVEPVFGSVLISTGNFILGDINNDREVNLLDIAPFVQTIVISQFCLAADANCDGIVNLLDVDYFVSLLAGTSLPVADPSIEDGSPHPGMLGDMNSDGFIDLLDVECFRHLGTDCPSFATGDINMDGNINLLDACPFVDLILSIE